MGFRQALYDHTEGNPLFTVELLRSFERQGALVREETGQWIEAPGLDWEHVPARVEAVIVGHLAGLPDQDRALATYSIHPRVGGVPAYLDQIREYYRLQDGTAMIGTRPHGLR